MTSQREEVNQMMSYTKEMDPRKLYRMLGLLANIASHHTITTRWPTPQSTWDTEEVAYCITSLMHNVAHCSADFSNLLQPHHYVVNANEDAAIGMQPGHMTYDARPTSSA